MAEQAASAEWDTLKEWAKELAEQEKQLAKQRAEHEKQRAEHEKQLAKQRAEHEKQLVEKKKQLAEQEKELAEQLAEHKKKLAEWIPPTELKADVIRPCILGYKSTYQEVGERVERATCEAANTTRILIQRLIEHQDHKQEIAPFLSIVNSSGTGKSQLAQTTQVLTRQAKDVSVLYLLANTLDIENAQQFYKEHIYLGILLCDAFSPRSFPNDHDDNGFTSAAQFGSIPSQESAAFGLLFILLEYAMAKKLPETAKIPLPRRSFEDLRNFVAKQRANNHKFLVFVDEVPAHNNRKFFAAINLRNVLCAVGIAPIMMSTYAGLINAMGATSGAGFGDNPPTWTVVIPSLPPFVAPPTPPQSDNFLAMLQQCASLDRPLIAQILQDYIANFDPQIAKNADHNFYQDQLEQLIRKVAHALYTRKPQAWRSHAQLLLPFSAGDQPIDNDNGERFPEGYAHAIVGEHFGHFFLQTEQALKNPKEWLNQARCSFSSCKKEPFLIFALLFWFKGAPPLLDHYASPITALKAFLAVRSSDGDALEAVIHGAMTLASFADGVQGGGPLGRFLGNIARLVCYRSQTTTPLLDLTDVLPTDWAAVLVPVLPPGGDLPLFAEYGYCASCTRPPKNPNAAQAGVLKFQTRLVDSQKAANEKAPKAFYLSVDSINQEQGFDTHLFKTVMKRVDPGVNLLIVITPYIERDIFFGEESEPVVQHDDDGQQQQEEQFLSGNELFTQFCREECKHNAFEDPKNRLRIVAVRETGEVKYVKVAGEKQRGDPKQITLMVVIFVVDIQQAPSGPASKRPKLGDQTDA